MYLSKVVLVATLVLLVAVSAGAILGLTFRPATPQHAAPSQAAAKPLQAIPPTNCAACALPPPGKCMPAGLSFACQQCYADSVNSAGIMPSSVYYNNRLGWVFDAKQGAGYSSLMVEFPTCP